MAKNFDVNDATILALCNMLEESNDTNTYKVEYNDGAVQRSRRPNKSKTIKGTDNDLMEFLDEIYVDCTIDDETDELKTLNDWLNEYEECYDPSGSTVVLKITKNGEDIYINEDYDYFMNESKKQEGWLEKEQPKNWCGIEGIKHIWNGSWSDPQIEYNGNIYNEWDVQEYVGDIFNNELEEQGKEIPQGDKWIDAFSKWCKENSDWVKAMIEELEPDKVVKENKEIKTESEKWDSDGLTINGWHLEEETTNGGITRYWLYNPKGLGGSLIIYPDTLEELNEYISKNQQVIGFEGNYLPKTIYNKIISLVRNGTIKLRGKQEENKQLNEERYYYGEINDIKTNIQIVTDYLNSISKQAKNCDNNSEFNEYNDLQKATLQSLVDNISKCIKIIQSSDDALTKNFPTRIGRLTPEQKEYIEKHKDEIKTESKKLNESFEIYDSEFNKEDNIISGAGQVDGQEFVFDYYVDEDNIDIKDFMDGSTFDISNEICNEIIDELKQTYKLEESKDINYISKEEFDSLPEEYKTTIKDTIDTEVNYWGKDREEVTKMYKDLGYDETDAMILTSSDKGTVLKPVKITENKKLTENEMTALAKELPDDREPNDDTIDENVNAVVDGILVVVDPEINEDDYQEVIDRAQEIIEDTPEGKIPFIEDYLNQYIQTCPICGKTFVSKQLLQSGDTCPLCLEQPEQFITVGKIEPDAEQKEEMEQAGEEDLSNDIEIEQNNTEANEEAIEEFSIEEQE